MFEPEIESLEFRLPAPLLLKPDQKLDITFLDGTVVHARVVDAAPPSDDGSVSYTVSWEAGE